MNESLREQLALPPMDQVGFVVRDLDTAVANYDALFGPFTIEEYGVFEYQYRGTTEPCELRIAFGRSGDIEIELIEWISGGSPHKEFLDAGREGMHHLRFRVDDLDAMNAAAATLNFKVIWGTRFGEGLAVSYLEREGDELLIEFYENLHDPRKSA